MGAKCCKSEIEVNDSETPQVVPVHPEWSRLTIFLDDVQEVHSLEKAIDDDAAKLVEAFPCSSDPDAAIPCTLTQDDKKVGDHVCPVVGKQRVDFFKSAQKLQKLFEESSEDLGRIFSLEHASITATSLGREGGFACTVSDPTVTDCPLMFVSKGFEEVTGYEAEFSCGRSCRFLQPTDKVLNDAFNLEDRKQMREFCTDRLLTMLAQKSPDSMHGFIGEAIVNIILNETFSGDRFWNLLRMQYVQVDGDIYILAVQTPLDAYMPKILQKKVQDKTKNIQIVEALSPFFEALNKIRAELRTKVNVPFMELKGFCTCQMNFLEMLPILDQVSANIPDKQIAALPNADAPLITKGTKMKAQETIKYPSYAIPAKSTGEVVSIDAFGNIVIKWDSTKLGKAGVLKRDIKTLKVVNK